MKSCLCYGCYEHMDSRMETMPGVDYSGWKLLARAACQEGPIPWKLASHHSQCSFTHSPVLWFGAVNDFCPYLSLSSDSGQVEAAAALLQLSFPFCWRNIPSPLFYFGARMLMPFPHLLEDSVYLVKLLQNFLSFRKRGQVLTSMDQIPSFIFTNMTRSVLPWGTAWSTGHIYRNKISIRKKE